MKHAALLRAVNVGGNNKLPMKELAAIFEDAGATDVRTYIQSGNVAFGAEPGLADAIASRVEAAILARYGFAAPVYTRTAEELREIAANNPFLAAGLAPETLHIGFMPAAPTAEQIAKLDPDRSPPDRFVVRGREIFLHFASGVGKTKLTPAFFDKLGARSTVRNLRTLQALIDLTA